MRLALVLLVAGATTLLVGTLAAGASARGSSTTATLTVSAQANIFGAGQSSPPAPAGRGPGESPVHVALPPGTTEVRFTGGRGSVTCCTGLVPPSHVGPEGGHQVLDGSTRVSAYGGLSGVELPDKQMFLAGVFLRRGAPSGAGPPARTNTRKPTVAQIFYVGAGPLTVAVPADATRLFLGFVDGFNFKGPAGHYDDNAGSVRIEVSTAAVSGPKPASGLSVSLVNKRFAVAAKNVPSCNGRSSASGLECTVRNRAVLTLCNRDQFPHRPFSFSKFNAFGGPSNPVVLRPGKCMKRTLVNPTKKPLRVRIYDELHSQERFLVTVMPAGA